MDKGHGLWPHVQELIAMHGRLSGEDPEGPLSISMGFGVRRRQGNQAGLNTLHGLLRNGDNGLDHRDTSNFFSTPEELHKVDPALSLHAQRLLHHIMKTGDLDAMLHYAHFVAQHGNHSVDRRPPSMRRQGEPLTTQMGVALPDMFGALYPIHQALRAQTETRKLITHSLQRKAPDWRPDETLPEDYYALARRGRKVRF